MSEPLRVLVTGATGCVGRYVVDDLLANGKCSLLLQVRDPKRLPTAVRENAHVSILCGDLRDADARFESALGSVDVAVLAATSWGPQPDAHDVNVSATLALAGLLARGRCRHILHFATASVLGYDHSPLPQAADLGTPYIRSKAECARLLRDGAVTVPVSILYPTLVVGGGERDIPRSHLYHLLQEIARHHRFLRFVRAAGSFHAIHAADIARIVTHLVAGAPPAGVRELVLGGAPVTIETAIDALCTTLGVRRYGVVRLNPTLADACIRLFGIRLGAWDRFCLGRAHFTHRQPIMPEDVGGRTTYPTFASLAAFALRGQALAAPR